MATLTISLTGSAIVSGTKSYTVSDADLQSLLDTYSQDRAFIGMTPTNQQILLAWVQGWIERSKADVLRSKTTSPPPITIS